jgi:hypothetical protein
VVRIIVGIAFAVDSVVLAGCCLWREATGEPEPLPPSRHHHMRQRHPHTMHRGHTHPRHILEPNHMHQHHPQRVDALMANSRAIADGVNPPTPHEQAEGLAALEAFGRGEVELVQRRVDKFKFDYIAQKRKKIEPPTVCGGMRWVPKMRGPYAAGVRY